MAVYSVIDLPIDVWLLILDEICAKDYASLRGTCTQLDKFIAPILWEKLEVCIIRENLRQYRAQEPRHVKEPKRWELNSYYSYISMEKDRHKVWMALGLEELRERMQTTDWLTDRLPYVKTFVLHLYGYYFSDRKLLRICGEPGGDDDVEITSSFHWLLKIGLPKYSTLTFIDVRIAGFVKQQWKESISHLVEHFDCAEYYLTYGMPRNVDQFARDSKLLCCENLKGVVIHGNWESGDEMMPKIDLKFPPGVEAVALECSGDCCSNALDELLEECRNIKRLVVKYSINAYFKTSIPKSIEWLELPQTFPSLKRLNLENIVKLGISVGQLKDLKLQGISNLRDLTLGEEELQDDDFYEVPGEILKSALTMWPIQRLDFDLNSAPLLKVLIESPSPMYSSLRSVSFRNAFKYLSVEEPIGHEFLANDIREFIKICENLEFLVLGSIPGDEDVIAIFSCAIERCDHLSELYVDREGCDDLRGWDEILMPEEFPYDPVGDLILDCETLNPVKVERLRQYTEYEWNQLYGRDIDMDDQ